MTTELIQWEHKIVCATKLSIDKLDEIGNEGWELTAVLFCTTSAAGYDHFDYYFKRPKQNKQQ